MKKFLRLSCLIMILFGTYVLAGIRYDTIPLILSHNRHVDTSWNIVVIDSFSIIHTYKDTSYLSKTDTVKMKVKPLIKKAK